MQGIYQIRNINNNKVYIGSSKDITKRIKTHKTQLDEDRHHSYRLQKEWNKGYEFIFEVLEEVKNSKELIEKEQYYLDLCQSYLEENGYNILRYANGKDYMNKDYLNSIETKPLEKAKLNNCLKSTEVISNGFLKISVDTIPIMLDDFTDKDNGKIDNKILTFLFYLMQFIDYQTGILSHANGKVITNKFILKDCNMNRSDIYRCLKTLKDKKIIILENKYYIFNPFIINKGIKTDNDTIKLFQDTKYNINKIKMIS